MNNRQRKAIGCWLLLFTAWLAWSEWGGGFAIPGIVAPKVTAVTYVREVKDIVPSGVSAALNELNTKGIIATEITESIVDGENQVPDQYKVTLPAAKAAGVPVLVVQAGETVVRTVKAPTTKEQVLEAAQ